MNSLLTSLPALRRALHRFGFDAALRRLALTGLGLVLVACGGHADAPPPPETVPVITTQPADQSVVVGAEATFSVAAGGAPPLAYQWSSSADGIGFTPIAGATGASYGTGATALIQSGTVYRVVVSNPLGSVTSSAVRLTVTPAVVAPAITVQPTDQTVTAPATATFSVTATGTAPAYEWQSSSDAGVTFTPVAGAANAPSLAVSSTSVAQSGWRYRVRVSNTAGSVTSNAALLTVNAAPAAPAFTTQPAAQTIVAGASASFAVVATGTPAPALQWRLNGLDLANGPLASGVCSGAGVAGATSASLSLTAVPLGCSGAVVSVVASNGVGPDATSTGATLTVNSAAAAPTITLQPSNASVFIGNTATFSASASGVPTPTVQWQQSLDGGATWANITGATSINYTTPVTVTGDSGKRLRAVFTNASGSATSNAAVLTAETPAPPPTNGPNGVAVDSAGNLYVADTGNAIIRKITPAGVVSTLAGLANTTGSADGAGSDARFFRPQGLTIDAAGNLYVVERSNHAIRKITPAGVVSTLAGLATTFGTADGIGSVARFRAPGGIVIDGSGNLFVADSGNNQIRSITPAAVVATLAGTWTDSGSADGTGSAARFVNPTGIALDATGNLFVADKFNHTIRKVTPGGVVTTFAGLALATGSTDGTGAAARFFAPHSIAIDAAGSLYVADSVNHTIRKVTSAGVVTTFAGLAGSSGSSDGTGTAARFNDPRGVAIDAAGNLYVADSGNNAIRKITPAGIVTTVGF